MTRERAEREGRGGRRTLDPLDHVHARRDLAEDGVLGVGVGVLEPAWGWGGGGGEAQGRPGFRRPDGRESGPTSGSHGKASMASRWLFCGWWGRFGSARACPSLPHQSRKALRTCDGPDASVDGHTLHRRGAHAVLMNNWEPPEPGPAFAMLSVPGSLVSLTVCSSGMEPSEVLFSNERNVRTPQIKKIGSVFKSALIGTYLHCPFPWNFKFRIWLRASSTAFSTLWVFRVRATEQRTCVSDLGTL